MRKRETSPTRVDIPSARRLTAQFRQDLKISSGGSNKPGGKAYVVEDPVTHESFSFGEEEYFLCKAMDGTSTSEEVLNRFQRRFGVEMTEVHFRNFEEHLLAMGLAESAPLPKEQKPEHSAKEAPVETPVSRERRNPRWKLFNPERIFNFLLRIVLPFRSLVTFLLWTLVPSVAVSFYLIFRHWTEFRVFLASFVEVLGYFGGLLFGLMAANLVRCLVQGVVCAYYQLTPSEFGIKLRRGVLPRFYIEKDRVRRADRSTRLWIYGTAILVRLVFITLGAFLWILFKDSNTLLPFIAVMIAQVGMIGLVLQLVPIETTDGYRWLVTFFNLPPNMIFIALEVLKLRIRGKPLPLSLAGGRGVRYLLYSLFLITVLTLGAYKITIGLAQGLSQVFPNILGRATDYVFLAIIAVFIVQWALRTFSDKSKSSSPSESQREAIDFDKNQENATDSPERFGELLRRHRLLFIGVLLSLIMLIPCPYRPGGEIQILPPAQVQIQAPISGQITDVYFEGGDGKFISKGTLVGKMISYEIENQILTLEQRKAQQLATIEKAKSELSKLIAGYREEEIKTAQAKLDEAIEEVNLATQELAAAKVNDAYSSVVLPSYEKLYKSGSIAYLQYEEVKKMAGINKINVEKQQKNLAAVEKTKTAAQAQLDLLRSGSRQEDIDSARHAVEEAEAELSRLEQQIQYAIQQQKKGELLMPLDGYLVTARLGYKKGAYLKVGESFATAQTDAQPLVEVQLPEYDTQGVVVGAKATVKLFASPGSPLHGKVLSIQPAAIPSSSQQQTQTFFGARMFTVLIELEKPPFVPKTGSTGYAKISAGFQPLGLLLARPTMRFIQIEVWSWLP